MWMTPRTSRYLAGAALLALAACSRQPRPSSPATAPTDGAQPGSAPGDSVQVGYGTQRRDKVTGAVTSMSDTEISRRPLQLEQLLRGRVPGLQIIYRGNDVLFRIRGNNSANTDEEPLVVVDNVMIPSSQLSSALSGLTPGDIKRVDVLKDVASTSIYGFRGSAGVIVITTKR